MSLGSTIALRRQHAAGSWSVRRVLGGELALSERADVAVLGGGLPAAPAAALLLPRELTVTLRPRARGESLETLRRELLPFCRPEAGPIALFYTGAQRRLRLECSYRDGLETLALRFVAHDPRWWLWVDEDAGATYPEGVWEDECVPQGTAAAPLELWSDGPGLVSWIGLNAGGTAYRLTFQGVSLAAQQRLFVSSEARAVSSLPPGYGLGHLQAGSRLASFQLVPGVLNILQHASTTAAIHYAYVPRYWSWEDADQV